MRNLGGMMSSQTRERDVLMNYDENCTEAIENVDSRPVDFCSKMPISILRSSTVMPRYTLKDGEERAVAYRLLVLLLVVDSFLGIAELLELRCNLFPSSPPTPYLRSTLISNIIRLRGLIRSLLCQLPATQMALILLQWRYHMFVKFLTS
jgi:hypothetical protein